MAHPSRPAMRAAPDLETPIPAEILGQWIRRFEILARKKLTKSIHRLADEIEEWAPEIPGRDSPVADLADCGLLPWAIVGRLEDDFPTVGELVDGDITHIRGAATREKIREAAEKIRQQWFDARG